MYSLLSLTLILFQLGLALINFIYISKKYKIDLQLKILILTIIFALANLAENLNQYLAVYYYLSASSETDKQSVNSLLIRGIIYKSLSIILSLIF